MGEFGIDTYKQEQGRPGPGTPSRFGVDRFALSFLSPRAPQSNSIEITAGDAGNWSITVTNDDTLESVTVTWTGDATTTATASALAVAWNASSEALNFARATYDGASTVVLGFRSDKYSYTSVVTPGGAGTETTTVTAESGFLAEFGAWSFHTAAPATTEAFRTLQAPTGGTLATLAGLIVKPLHVENADPTSNIRYGHYRKGNTVSVMRKGRMWVPVGVDVTPASPVFAVTSGTSPRPGWTVTTGGDLDLSTVARFISDGKAGGVAEVELHGLG